MKYISLLLGVAAIYYFLGRNTPIAPVAKEVTAAEVVPLTTGPRETAAAAPAASGSPASTALKRPFDRTHAALEQVKQRNGAGEF